MNKKVMTGVIATLLLVGCVVLYGLVQRSSDSTVIDEAALKSGASKSFEDMSEEELEARTRKETGNTVSDLRNKDKKNLPLKDYEQAATTAQVLYAVGEIEKSMYAFEEAEKKIKVDDGRRIDFYNDYRNAADAAGEYEKGDEAVRKQIIWYEQSNDPAAKQQLEILKQRLEVRQRERQR